MASIEKAYVEKAYAFDVKCVDANYGNPVEFSLCVNCEGKDYVRIKSAPHDGAYVDAAEFIAMADVLRVLMEK